MKENECVCVIDGISFKLKEPHDFSFLNKYGKVFKVFDKQSSGNICFGVIKDNKKYFLKYAGAKTINDKIGNTEDAISRLKNSVKKYQDLSHPLLINYLYSEDTKEGFIMVFDWFDGVSCGYPQKESYDKFLALSIEEKERVYKGILVFFEHVIKCGYIAIDFNDQSTLYNFANGEFLVCDIDFYAKQSYMNGTGVICGDPFLTSPEETRSYAIVDEVSNVYCLGSLAFLFFANEDKNSKEKWQLDENKYLTAKKAINPNRSKRQKSIAVYCSEWNK